MKREVGSQKIDSPDIYSHLLYVIINHYKECHIVIKGHHLITRGEGGGGV